MTNLFTPEALIRTAMLLLIFPITPIVAFASKRAPVDEPASARVVER